MFCQSVYRSHFEEQRSNGSMQLEYRFVGDVRELAMALGSPGPPRWDIVLLDVMLPGGEHGDAAIPLIRQRLGSVAVLIVVSAHAQVSLMQRCLLLGADSYLEKPIGRQTISTLWQHWLVKNRARIPTASIPESPLRARDADDDASAAASRVNVSDILGAPAAMEPEGRGRPSDIQADCRSQ